MRDLVDIILAPAVVAELRAAPGKPGSGVPDLPWIGVRAPTPAARDEVERGLRAHAGEVETLALGVEGTAVPVIDERPATRYAVERGLGTAPTLAVLVDLHRRGLATRTIQEDVAVLRGAGMYLTEDLIDWTIERAQVSGPPGPDRWDVLGQ